MDIFNRKTNSIERANNNKRFKRRKATASEQTSNNDREIIKDPEQKFRPLTGKMDCPNCVCDRLMSGLCEECSSLAYTSTTGSRLGFGVYKNQERNIDEGKKKNFCSPEQNEAAIGRNTNCSSEEQPTKPASHFRSQQRRR